MPVIKNLVFLRMAGYKMGHACPTLRDQRVMAIPEELLEEFEVN